MCVHKYDRLAVVILLLVHRADAVETAGKNDLCVETQKRKCESVKCDTSETHKLTPTGALSLVSRIGCLAGVNCG